MNHLKLFCCVAAIALTPGGEQTITANPLVMTHPVHIASEELNVVLSSESALIDGRFRFQGDPATKGTPWETADARVSIPIWIPMKASEGDPALAALLDSASKDGSSGEGKPAIESWKRATGFKFTIANHEVPVSNFWVSPPPRTFPKETDSTYRRHSGWIVVCATVEFPPKLLRGSPEIRIQYRQPLRRTRAGAEFLYLPEFYSLPKGTATADLHRYAMVLKTSDGISASIGSVLVPSGHSARLPLVHQQPIKVLVVTP